MEEFSRAFRGLVALGKEHRSFITKIEEDCDIYEVSTDLLDYRDSDDDYGDEVENDVGRYREAQKIFEERLASNEKELAALKKEVEDLCQPENLLKEFIKDFLPTCEICMNNYDHNEHWQSCITVCGHMFGKSCIEKNFENNNRCPKCNRKYEKKDIITLF